MPDDYVNLHVRIQRSKRNKLNIYIPWGTRDKMFRALVDDILEICEMGNGPEFISLIITKHVKLTSKGLEVNDAKLPNDKQEHNPDVS
jgi:hypothetical protein